MCFANTNRSDPHSNILMVDTAVLSISVNRTMGQTEVK